MKAEKIGANLFMLTGKTLQKAYVCVTSNGEESAKMWCLKLDYMSEEDLNILSKIKLLPKFKSLKLSILQALFTSK